MILPYVILVLGGAILQLAKVAVIRFLMLFCSYFYQVLLFCASKF